MKASIAMVADKSYSMDKVRISLLAASTAILLSACGGASTVAPIGAPPSGSAPLASNVINGIVVPPDPGKENDETVAGIDSDNNGIRDDIDRWIATKYGDKPGALEAIRMRARATQKILKSNPTTQVEALALVHSSIDVGACTGPKLRSESISTSQFSSEAFVRHYNTKDRASARKKVFALAGMITGSVDDPLTIDCPYEWK